MTPLGDYLFTTVFIVGAVIYAIYHIWLRFYQRCDKCGNTLRPDPDYKFDESSDTVGLFKQPRRKKRAYKCPFCGTTVVRESLGHE